MSITSFVDTFGASGCTSRLAPAEPPSCYEQRIGMLPAPASHITRYWYTPRESVIALFDRRRHAVENAIGPGEPVGTTLLRWRRGDTEVTLAQHGPDVAPSLESWAVILAASVAPHPGTP